MRVLSVAYPLAQVSDDPAGGAEQVLAQLDRALVAAGHESTVIAAAGSCVVGRLVALPDVPPGEIDNAVYVAAHATVRAALAREAPAHDLVHFHGIDFASYLPAEGPPVLATLHLPLDWYPPEALRPRHARTWLLPVSDDQARRAPAGVSLLPAIANGVDLDLYRPAAKQDYALVLGRVAPEKGFADALRAAHAAGVPLRVAGALFPYPEHLRYFESEVRPLLDAERIWLGPVAGAAKRRLLAEAACVLIPSTAPETSSLVAMEALASGTPVIAYAAGALPSIVEHGVTGFVVDGIDAMAAAIARVGTIDSARCRAAAYARFGLERTTAAYLDLYRRLAA